MEGASPRDWRRLRECRFLEFALMKAMYKSRQFIIENGRLFISLRRLPPGEPTPCHDAAQSEPHSLPSTKRSITMYCRRQLVQNARSGGIPRALLACSIYISNLASRSVVAPGKRKQPASLFSFA